MVNFPKRLLHMAMQACLSKRALLLVGWRQYAAHAWQFWQGARRETDLRWVVLNLVGGANACLQVFSAHVASNEDDVAVKSVSQPQSTESHF